MEPIPIPTAISNPSRQTATPAGTLTFLMTDVEGSTPLWERHEATMRAALRRHDALLADLLSVHGGHQIKERGEGDSVFAVFADPAAALAAAVAIQLALMSEPWPPETPIRVRMGLHSGWAELYEGDYYGPVVNRCARIKGLGHGGQILLSQVTAALARAGLPDAARVRSLGGHTLKGMDEAEEVYQVVHPDLPAEFPALASPQAPKHNLPVQPTSFVGREQELAAMMALVGRAPLVTLTGTGGCGKTRLALQLAGELLEAYPDGVRLVELGALSDPALVVGTTATAMGLREEPGHPMLSTLIDFLRDRQLLLLLDNCEHVIEACADLASALLRGCPRLRLVATSREGLHIPGEATYHVPSLSLPDLASLPPPEQLVESAAVALFVARARARRADFALTRQNALAVAQICARLDGIPLAIELAAGRVGGLPLETIAARLDRSLGLLVGGPRTTPSRQQTLRGALDWSWELLSAQERTLLRRLAVFADGWTIEAAEVVCTGDDLDTWEVADLAGLPCGQVAGDIGGTGGGGGALPAAGAGASVWLGAGTGGWRGVGYTGAASRVGCGTGRRGRAPAERAGPGPLAGSPGGRARQPARGAGLGARTARWRSWPAIGCGPEPVLVHARLSP